MTVSSEGSLFAPKSRQRTTSLKFYITEQGGCNGVDFPHIYILGNKRNMTRNGSDDLQPATWLLGHGREWPVWGVQSPIVLSSKSLNNGEFNQTHPIQKGRINLERCYYLGDSWKLVRFDNLRTYFIRMTLFGNWMKPSNNDEERMTRLLDCTM